MENNNNKKKNIDSINELIPLDLLREIFLKLPINHLVHLKRVCKLWNVFISNQKFARSHFELSLAPTPHRCLLIRKTSGKPQSADLDVLFHNGGYTAAVKNVGLPSERKKRPPTEYVLLGSCRGFVALQRNPYCFIIWNPLTGSHKSISYYHRVVRKAGGTTNRNGRFKLVSTALVFGFGYDASRDDYLAVLAWRDEKNEKDHFDFFSVRANSWNSFEVALPNNLVRSRSSWFPGLFFDGAIHWLRPGNDDNNSILVFDLTERKSFSRIPLPKEVVLYFDSRLMVLGGCLALYSMNFWQKNTKIWVMKEYKVQSSWVVYEVPNIYFNPICLSSGGDIIGFKAPGVLAKYNVKGELLQYFEDFRLLGYNARYSTMYTESFMELPNEFEENNRKQKDQNRNEVKRVKRIRGAPTWALDFYCD